MIEEIKEPMFDLLAKKATEGLDPAEQAELDRLLAESKFVDDGSFDMAAAAIGLIDMHVEDSMPEHLFARILSSGDDHLSSLGFPEQPLSPATTDIIAAQTSAEQVATANPDADDFQKVLTLDPPRRSWNWLGWAVASVACIALAVNIWFTQFVPKEVVNIPTPPSTPEKLSAEQEYAKFMAESPGAVKANWAPGSPDAVELKNVSGDVVWSDSKQKGFMRFRGLPVNDKAKTTYQLWIFDKTQDAKYPIDGGTFDVDKDGEVIIPINAKLKAQSPGLFAITVEKPGGVVVSDRKRMAAVAKVETQTRSNT